MPLGTAMSTLAAVKSVRAELRDRRGEHVVHPEAERHEAGGEQRQHHDGIAEDPALRERLDDLRDEAEPRDEHDVDLGVAEEPVQVLPEQRVTPLGAD